ncbi:predicted protein [Nematostella vectensis]|uniref:G-protein coupled receptors family 1 profile domain-containing protein n=1 Tax=Nematostella vectensis TaxID=45351 RepID=A7RVV4_NEMVE|nr:substance-K receptor [Nematostella vectensis]EDO44453.1 predicted protein [Nematostella vectensis]|eukprot:XP_001636516.1 predicted protein [Nematostella vectensis]
MAFNISNITDEINSTVFSNNTSSPTGGPLSRELIKLIATIFFSIISALGVTGNLLVVIILIGWRDMRTPCNYLIANISAADLIVTLILSPLRVVEQYTRGWIFGEVLCYVFAPLQDALVSVSVYTFVVIALERYRAIINPFKPKLSKSKVLIIIGLIWVGCYAGTGLPLAFFVTYTRRMKTYVCYAAIPRDHFYLFALYLVIMFIALPLILQVVCYACVIHTLDKKDFIDRHGNEALAQRRVARQRRDKKRRLVKTLVVLMAVFHVCYVPRGVILLITEFAPFLTRSVAFAFADISTMLLYYVKHIMNPIILCGMSSDFRECFFALCCCRRRNGNTNIGSDSGIKTSRDRFSSDDTRF